MRVHDRSRTDETRSAGESRRRRNRSLRAWTRYNERQRKEVGHDYARVRHNNGYLFGGRCGCVVMTLLEAAKNEGRTAPTLGPQPEAQETSLSLTPYMQDETWQPVGDAASRLRVS